MLQEAIKEYSWNKWKYNLNNKKIKDTKKNQMEILELKNATEVQKFDEWAQQ